MPTFKRSSAIFLANSFVRALVACIMCSPLIASTFVYGQSVLRVFSATPGEPISSRFSVAVNGQSSPSYVAQVATPANFLNNLQNIYQAAFTSFDINGPVQVTVTYYQPVTKAVLLPSSSGITPQFSGNQVTFTVSQPGQLTLELNGSWGHSLHLFVNPFETNIPSPTDPNVIYFKQGIYHLGNTVVPAGKTVYLEAGAFIYANAGLVGPLFSLSGDNITFRGRGVIDGSLMPPHLGRLIYGYHNSNIKVEGVTLRDSGCWTFHLFRNQNAQVSNIKVFGWRINSDGIDIDSSQNVSVDSSFFRTYDDLVVVKTNNLNGWPASNIQVTKCVLWNQVAHALSVGEEILAPIQNVTFSNNDIIHDKGRMTLLAVYNGESALAQNISWSDIRIEQVERLLSVTVVLVSTSQSATRGKIANVSFSDVTSPTPSRSGPNEDIEGFDNSHEVTGLLFSGVTVGGSEIGQGDLYENAFVTGLSFTP